MADFQDRVLKCIDCGTDFIFTAGEQQFYHEKDFRCEAEDAAKPVRRRAQTGASELAALPGRVETSAICSRCGRETAVPFRPTQGRPVFSPPVLSGDGRPLAPRPG